MEDDSMQLPELKDDEAQNQTSGYQLETSVYKADESMYSTEDFASARKPRDASDQVRSSVILPGSSSTAAPQTISGIITRVESLNDEANNQAKAENKEKKAEEKNKKQGTASYLKSWLPKKSMLPKMLQRYRSSKTKKEQEDVKPQALRYVVQTRFVTFFENRVIAVRYINGGEERDYAEFDQVDPLRHKQSQLPTLRWDCEITFARSVTSLTTVDLFNYREVCEAIQNKDEDGPTDIEVTMYFADLNLGNPELHPNSMDIWTKKEQITFTIQFEDFQDWFAELQLALQKAHNSRAKLQMR